MMGVSDTTEEDWERHYKELYCHTIACPSDECLYEGECVDYFINKKNKEQIKEQRENES